MKKLKGLYEQIYDFENLHEAYREARKNKRYRDEVLKFSANLEENLIQIQNELIWKTYSVSRYREFFVYEPKKRLIMALPFKDRVVQWAIYRVLNPLIERRYIYDSYACRVGYGSHRAVNRLQCWLRKLERKHDRVYILKLDISKYFYRVDHDVLMKILRRLIGDEDLLWLLEVIVRCEHTNFGLVLGDHVFDGERVGGVGMPIGNLTSQMFANLYLNELDQFVKHTLREKHYMRYMDDALVLHPDKKHLWQVKQEIQRFVEDELHLVLNNKTTVRTINQGVDWVGYRVWSTHCKLRKSTAYKMKKRLKYLQKAYARGEVNFEDVDASVQSYIGALKHCNSYKLREKLFNSLVWKRN
ncbi:reverse transcriptase/maturase family protein [Desulfoscipio geothermicus]|uniref:Retron-type reverse transcriptase n=1 Tax=Desulfoscipio geothermicus DSM 3669 TaxID=1121426 RepID=A0A1I6EGA3_9FIRM|nr:reverse transcriptase/maturase family protein [Desulfoscipio geothermicus]SFR16799.1 Retron-type reverse transcriptase [Desulfoscipio geothermicus DSM 3669]